MRESNGRTNLKWLFKCFMLLMFAPFTLAYEHSTCYMLVEDQKSKDSHQIQCFFIVSILIQEEVNWFNISLFGNNVMYHC